jgi:hypothetical protein
MTDDDPVMGDYSFVQALKWVYYGKPTPDDYQKAVQVDSPGEFKYVEKDQFLPSLLVMTEEQGRYNALQVLYWNFKRTREVYDEHVFPLAVEAFEIEDLMDSELYITAILRSSAFLDAHFGEVNQRWKSDFVDRIDQACTEDTITEGERRLLHFVRKVRNDVAHNGWLDLEYPFDSAKYAALMALYIVGNLHVRSLEQYHSVSNDPAADTSPEKYLDELEEDYGWVFNEESDRWNPSTDDELPPM